MKKGIAPILVLIVLLVVGGAATATYIYLSDLPTSNDWVINGTSVYVNNDDLYLSATPHTITSSQEVIFELVSKHYNGTADLIFGFDYPAVKPVSVDYYNPKNVSEQKSYTCTDSFYNYTLTPKHFWCWHREVSNSTGVITDMLVFEHDFESAQGSTAYWTETHVEEWQNIANRFDYVDYEYEGMTRWYYTTFEAEAEKKYTMKSYIEIPIKAQVKNDKYWVCIKPHSESIAQAQASGHLYCLDPWWSGSFLYKMPISLNSTGAGAITNFTYYIPVDTDALITAGKMNADCSDLRFVDSTETTELSWEFDDYANTTTNGCGLTNTGIWLLVPSLAADNSTVVYMYYGNVAASLANTSGYDDNTILVFHMNNLISGKTIDAKNGVEATVVTENFNSSGMIGSGYAMNDDNGYISIADADSDLGGTVNTYTVEAWINQATTNAMRYAIQSKAGEGYPILFSSSSSYGGTVYGALYDKTNSPDRRLWPLATGWHYNAFIRDNTTDDNICLYLDTASNCTADTTVATIDSTAEFLIGIESDKASTELVGMIDELVIHKVDREDDWMKMRHDNQLFTLYEFGLELGANYTEHLNYSDYSYENVKALHNSTFTLLAATGTVSGTFTWDGTTYTATASNSTPYNWSLYSEVLPPIITTNRTNVTFYWNYTTVWDGGGTTTDGGTVYNQTQLYGFYWSQPTSNTTTAVIGDGIQLNSTRTALNSTGATFTSNYLSFNGTVYTPSSSGTVYYKDLSAPAVYDPTTFNYTFRTNITYDGSAYMRESDTTSYVTVSPVYLWQCNGTGTPIFQFDIWNEEGFGELLSDFDGTFRIYSSYPDTYTSYNFSYTGNHTHLICVYPNTTSQITIDSDIEYANQTELYPPRYYFIRNGVYENITNQVELYLLNSTYAENIQFQVTNSNGIAEDDAVLDAQRYYEGNASYWTVAMGLTDDAGYTNIRLRPYDVYYRFIAYRNGTIIKIFQPLVISSTSNLMIIEDELIGDMWNYYGDILYSCEYTNATSMLECTASDTGGNQHTYSLVAYRERPVSQEEICSEEGTGATVTLLCDLSAYTSDAIKYVFYVEFENNHDVLYLDGIRLGFEGEYGDFGLLFSFMLLTALVFAGLYNPTVALTGALITMIVSVALGWLTISSMALVAIILVIIIAIAKVRS